MQAIVYFFVFVNSEFLLWGSCERMETLSGEKNCHLIGECAQCSATVLPLVSQHGIKTGHKNFTVLLINVNFSLKASSFLFIPCRQCQCFRAPTLWRSKTTNPNLFICLFLIRNLPWLPGSDKNCFFETKKESNLTFLYK